ncbi:MAG TPA: RNA polymerase sigma factor [Candidatus Limnocylindrales bacterium]|nr:RNA polymerase sigma factor [Candidatus Limnocylindrales bacterium]
MNAATTETRPAIPASVMLEHVARARAGDREAFDLIAASVVDRLYSIARLVLRDADLAEDAVQDALVRCWRDLPMLRDDANFDSWVRRLLMNAITDEFRRAGRRRTAISLLRLDPPAPDPAEDVATREQLARGFQRLTLDHRKVLVLRLYLGLSLEETATTLGIPAGTAKSRLHYAIEAMRVALEADARPPIQEVSA